MTEWLFISIGEGDEHITNDYPAWNNMGGAVAGGGFFNTLFRHADEIRLADMTGMIEYAGIAKTREQVFAQLAYYVFQMYAAAKGQRVLPVSTTSGTYAITDPRYLFPSGEDVPSVDSTATISPDGSSLTIFVVNRSLKPTRTILM
jgi:alpha-L-arabinofuranosidase